MSIKQLRKLYDELTPRERFSLMSAAQARGDDAELESLIQTAPRRGFTVPNTHALSDTFNFLSMWYTMTQLGNAATLFYLIANDPDNPAAGLDGEGINKDDLMLQLQRNILTTAAAWRAICKEYDLDPENLVKDYPYIIMMELAELFVTVANLDNPLDLPNLQRDTDSLRTVIETKRKEWE